MDQFEPILQNDFVSGWKPLISLAIFAAVGSFFLGALYTSLRRGIKEEGWFNFKNGKEED